MKWSQMRLDVLKRVKTNNRGSLNDCTVALILLVDSYMSLHNVCIAVKVFHLENIIHSIKII